MAEATTAQSPGLRDAAGGDDVAEGPTGQKKRKNWTNPIKIYLAYRKRLRMEKEQALMLREERMNEDLERYLMEIEEHRCWVVFQLGHINFERMKKREVLNKLTRSADDRQKQRGDEWEKENGLSYFLGTIQSYKRWQNSPAKYLDFLGHQGAVTSCRLSPCLQYMLSCSEDKTIKLWNTGSCECLKTLTGHTKVVNDADFHVDFKMFQRHPSIVSGSGDGTLMIWNGSDTRAVATLHGHENAVYRVAFCPDGKSIVSCSEDMTVRTWCFPEGYNLFIYRGHSSGVLSVRFSGSGRYLASGSDYGERKILLWDAKLPTFNDPQQFPHIFFWTPEGLIKKIVIRKAVPRPNFWLMQTQLHYINDNDFDIWPGEISDIEDDNNDEDEADGDDETEDLNDDSTVGSSKSKEGLNAVTADDVRELSGVTLRVTHVGTGGDQSEAIEYNPGGFLVVSIRSAERVIGEAFVDAMSKSSRNDIFLSTAGQRLGKFELDAPVPWLPMKKNVDAKGRIKYSRDIPLGMSQSKDGRSAIFRESKAKIPYKHSRENEHQLGYNTANKSPGDNHHEANDGEDELDYLKKLDIVWNCPQEENMGVVIVVANVKLKDSNEWLQLRYSVKESAVRVSASGEVKVREAVANKEILFNQEERHRLFWKHIREKDYQTAASFIDRRAIAHTARGSIYRRFRIMNLMVAMFDEISWMVLHTPFIFRQGVTKAVLLCESTFDEGAEEEENEVMGEPDEVPPTGETPNGRFDSPGAEDENGGSTNMENDGNQLAGYSLLDPEENGMEETMGDFDDGEAAAEIAPSFKIMSSEAAPISPAFAIGLRTRPTTKAQTVQMLPIKKLRAKMFEREVNKLADQATKAMLAAEMESLQCSQEMGLRMPNVGLLRLLAKAVDHHQQGMNESSSNELWQIHDSYDIQAYCERDLVEEAFQVQNESMHGIRARKPEASKHLQLVASEMIKTGKYGPDIEEYSMPLPAFFPARAGQCQYSLRPAIANYELSVNKFHKDLLPTTLAEVYVPTIRERATELYRHVSKADHRKYEVKLHSLMVCEARRKLLEDSFYVGSRRQTFLSLPGLSQHYPNPNYPVPAVITEDTEFTKPSSTKQSFVDTLLGRKVAASERCLAVGRKPKHLQGLSYAQWNVKLSKQPSRLNREISQMFAFDRVEYDTNVLGNLLTSDAVESVKSRRKKAFGLSIRSNSQKRKKIIVVRDVIKNGYPRAFFAGRRGSYPEAPALADFLLLLGKSTTPGVDISVSTVVEDKVFSGLVRRFKFNDFELAHHGAVNDLAFSPSETRLVTAGGDSLIKIWDPRDGTFVRSMKGHKGEVRSVQYTTNEQFLVSCGADTQILIWSLLTQTVQRVLKGHVDVVNCLSITSDCSVIVSASHDMTLKSWYTTPRAPATPAPPRVVSVSHDTAMLTWISPPCFNLDITAFHIQFRVGIRESWRPRNSTNVLPVGPEEHSDLPLPDSERAGLCIAPHLRTRTITQLIPATYYQFRVRAENRMGLSEWSQPSPLTRTEFGLPEAPERPLVVRMHTDFIELLWFTANPETFGSGSTSFQVQCQGNGLTFSDNDSEDRSGKVIKDNSSQDNNDGIETTSTIELSLKEAAACGDAVITAFQKIRERYDQTKNKLRKSEVFSLQTRQSTEDEAAFAVSQELSSDVIFQVLERSKDRTHIAVSAIYRNLHPGFLYSFRVRGLNRVGSGSWSETSLTSSTKATLPSAPARPFLVQSTLRSLTLRWAPPTNDGGSAITGYRVHLINTDKYIDLGRSTVVFVWDGLFPGKSYHLRVRAHNSEGASDFSEPNTVDDSHTSTAPPEKPSPAPLAVAGTWNELRYEIQVPYSNGAQIESMVVQQRLITPFSVGSWEFASGMPSFPVRGLLYRSSGDNQSVTSVPSRRVHRSNSVQSIKTVSSAGSKEKDTESEDPVEVMEFVDTAKQQDMLEESVRQLELLKNASGFNPHKADKGQLDRDIEALIHKQKPNGSRIRFRLQGLLPDSMYEVRMCFANNAGQGAFSDSSHRAKTNVASPPSACQLPVVIGLGARHIVLEVTVPFEGGAAVRFFQIEHMDLDDSTTVKLRLARNAMDQSTTVQYHLEQLRSGGSYIVRCCAESSVGPGPFSPWTKEINLGEALLSVDSSNSLRA